jgi:hypothetical protein
MYGWTDEMRSSAATLMQDVSAEADALFAKARGMISDPASADIGSLLRGYVDGVGSYVDVAFYRLRQLTDELGHVTGQLPAGQSFFNRNWSVDTDVLQRFCPDTVDSMFEPRTNDAVEATELLEWCPNECMDLAWPRALAGFMRLPRRLPFRAYSTDDAAAYVHPFRYQVLSRDLSAMWNTASPRALSSRFLAETETVETNRTVVIIQDRFGFGNFCHYLFDGITRVLHYVDHFGYQDEMFVFAGVPGRYQEIIGQALCEVARIPAASLYFPDRGILLKGTRKCVWFSDQKELHSHPAQMAHPQSLGMLSVLADLVPGTQSTAKRLYISRGDADRRRITNEADLTAALQARGFISVQLAKIPVEEQVGLFRNAEIVVGPHGMGLTHIVMGKNIGRVIELFHPDAGTNAYAFVARSAGMNYDYVLGQGVPATHSDFSVSVDRVLDLLGPEGMPQPRPNWRKNANLIPASRTFFGFAGGSPDPDPEWAETDFSPMIANQSARFHRKSGPPGNTLVGQWPNIDVAPGALYVVSCWIWLPERCPANEISIRVGGLKAEQVQFANLALSKTWQRVSFTAINPKDAGRCSVGLHIVGHEGATIASTCWQLERGLMPSAYLATR